MQHTRTRTVTLSETFVICDRCSREMVPNDQDCEYQERIAVRFRAGYGSVLGDGNLVELDLCQHCLAEVLGEWLRVMPDDPLESAHSLKGEPKGAYQEFQLREVLEAEGLLRTLRTVLQKGEDG